MNNMNYSKILLGKQFDIELSFMVSLPPGLTIQIVFKSIGYSYFLNRHVNLYIALCEWFIFSRICFIFYFPSIGL